MARIRNAKTRMTWNATSAWFTDAVMCKLRGGQHPGAERIRCSMTTFVTAGEPQRARWRRPPGSGSRRSLAPRTASPQVSNSPLVMSVAACVARDPRRHQYRAQYQSLYCLSRHTGTRMSSIHQPALSAHVSAFRYTRFKLFVTARRRHWGVQTAPGRGHGCCPSWLTSQ